MSEKIRVITLRNDIPEGTTERKGFYLMNMGKEGYWLVDQEHPGYDGCIKKAMSLAANRKDAELVNKYMKLPAGTYKKNPIEINVINDSLQETITYEVKQPKSTGRKKNVK